MRRVIHAILVLFLLSAAGETHAVTPVHLWSQSFGGTSGDNGQQVATDLFGNVFIVGTFSGTVDFGGGPLVSTGAPDIIVAKYDAGGAHQWSRSFSAASNDVNGVATDAWGNVFVTGSFSGTMDFGGGPLSSAGFTNVFLVKFDPDGNYLWSYNSQSEGAGMSLTVDPTGSVIMVGTFNTVLNIGGDILVGINDVFVAKHDANGAYLWSQRAGDSSYDIPFDVASDPSGNVYITGLYFGTIDFLAGAHAEAGGGDIFLVKYDTDGSPLWSQSFGDSLAQAGYGIAADASGHVCVVGVFEGTLDFGGDVLSCTGQVDGYIATFDTNGNHLWSRNLAAQSGYLESAATDASGNVVIAGYFTGTLDAGGGVLTGNGFQDILVAKYDASGNHLWSEHLGGTGVDNSRSAAVGPDGRVVVLGNFQNPVDIGGVQLVSNGGIDMLLASYAGNTAEPTITSISDIGNDQGRQVLIEFERSGYDDPQSPVTITRYEGYRRIDAPPANAVAQPPAAGASQRELLAEGWTQISTVLAHGESGYSLVAPTIGDSTEVLGQYYSTFFIRAAAPNPFTFFDSPPDSGYSLDNLAPGIPGSLLYNGGMLSWSESTAEDFDYFTVYGAATNDFGAATVVDYTIGTDMDVTASPYVYYFVTATDFSGNEGAPIHVNTAADVGDTPQRYVLSLSNHPNPFNPRTSIKYTVPARGEVTVAIYDARGARVVTLVDDETRDTGAHSVEWNGRSARGVAVPSGIYFARIVQGDAVRSRKMVLLK